MFPRPCRRPGRAAPGVVVEHYYRELVSFLCARLGSRQAAEDVAHDAYLRVLERTGPERIEHPRAFLYRTALNLVVDRHRRHQVRQAEPLDVLDNDERWHSPALTHGMQLDQHLALMQRALDELSKPCRDSFLLRKLEGLSHQQIAESLGISRSLVEKHIVNAMKHCRVRMREWDC
ncbi:MULTISPECIES: sigma-70 family RNA polymerase sigma factor [Pseudomonas putida group]|uniref:sigma-70 family RNA polymerase sigma factor n=1 Tax=Pseudomonas putida group TaxID=136845 RepID=UPI0028709218|nr:MULTISPECIES: sigma-70 family RNA polymerase sigma factor [Pseudomonas putida group]